VTARLVARGIVVRYGGVSALDGVSFVVEPGQIAGFIGPNGSGKTTLLDVISGQTVPDRGTVMFDGIDVRHHLPEDRAPLGLIRSFQDCRLFPDLTVEETLLVGEDARRPAGVLSSALSLPRARKRELAKRAAIEGLIDALGLSPFRHNLVSELSTGTRRIVDLAIVMAAHPRLLLLDEPTAGIAQREAEAFGPLLRRVHQVTGATICLVEHDVPLVLSLCDRLFVMEAGRIVSQGTPEEVMADPVSQAAYLGASSEALARSGVAPMGKGA
jgi:ABC-type branched-subunit amino acid transport system ATPase component